MKKYHFITICWTKETKVGKVYHKDGTKEVLPHPAICLAKTVPVNSLEELQVIIQEVSEKENHFLLFGVPKEIPPNEIFVIASKAGKIKNFGEHEGVHENPNGLKVITREKINFLPSAFVLFDHDIYKDTPPRCNFQGRPVRWLAKMAKAAPEFDNAKCLLYGSGSSRVKSGGGFHAVFEMKKPDFTELYREQLRFHFLQKKNYRYEHRIKNGRVFSTIFDPSTLQIARLDFCGKPHAIGLDVAPLKCEILNPKGGKLDPPNRKIKPIEKLGLKIESSKDLGFHAVDYENLKETTKIETQEHGVITFAEYKEKYLGKKLRCQSPFRPESRSWAAMLNVHENNTPFLFDSGTGIKYVIKRKKTELTYLDQVQMREIEYIWYPYIAKGMITTITGPADVGKSSFIMRLVASITTGRPFPGETVRPEIGKVAILNAEDSNEEVIVPRLKAAQADLSKVISEYTTKNENGREVGIYFPEDIEHLERILTGDKEIRVVIIDPLTAFLGKVKENDNKEMRNFYTILGQVARNFDVSIIIVSHFNRKWDSKANDHSIKECLFGSGSNFNASRFYCAFVPDPYKEDGLLFGMLKHNYVKKEDVKTISLSLDSVQIEGVEGDFGIIVYNGEAETDVREITTSMYRKGKDKITTDRVRIGLFLSEAVKDGPRQYDEVARMAEKHFGRSKRWMKERINEFVGENEMNIVKERGKGNKFYIFINTPENRKKIKGG